MAAPVDCTIKIYTRGNLAGKLAIFFTSDKAKEIAKNKLELKSDILATINREHTQSNAEKLLSANKLHYEIIKC
jgi:hypothetical protein